MQIKRALIVDDSKTAQFKLKKTLDIYELNVDLAISAEDALSYLAYQIPDIIFMDHSMKGMNGLEAVKIIKANPATATIPVVMYTAEKGDVYLSQARAIGALDVISKDVMRESDIQRVMKGVNIKLVKKTQPSATGTILRPSASDEDTSDHLVRIGEQVSQSMRTQQNHISRDIQDNTRLMTRRFMHELRGIQEELKQHQKQQRELAIAAADAPETSKRPSALWAIIPLIGVLCAAIYGAIELSQIKRDNDLMRDIYRELAIEQADQNNAVLASLKSIRTDKSKHSGLRSEQLLAALVWAINQNGQYEFSEQAFGDDRIGLMSGLINFLDQAQFKGSLTLGIHSGNFCVVSDPNGQLSLPEQNITTSSCELLSTYDQDFSSATQTSASFMNFLNTSPSVESGRLKVDIQSHGIYSPRYAYPAYSDASNNDTSRWNAVAAANNRLTVALTRD